MKHRRYIILGLAMAVLAAVSLVLVGCGGTMGSADDKALFDKVIAMYANKDTNTAKEMFATDANIYWNWPKPSGVPADQTTGIEEISALVATAEYGTPAPLGDDVFSYTPSAKDLDNMSVAYKGVHYISGPVYVERDPYLLTLEVRDGKVINQFVEAWH